MRNILYFQYPWRLWRLRLSGLYRYAEKADWHVQVVEYGLTDLPVHRALEFWRPDGCVVEGLVLERDGSGIDDFGDCPTVFCDADGGKMTGPYLGIEHDSDETAALAAQELLSLGFDDYAFVGNIRPREWSDRRRKVFSDAVARAGRTFHAFETGPVDCIAAFFDRIRPWLRGLPKPCGIFAANDISGDLVLQACRMERLTVPDDVAVAGVDNDELICTHATPTLTSVMPDFECSGYLAGQLLDEAFSGCRPPKIVKFGATHVVRRNSTVKFVRRDDAVRKALDMIQLRACTGITPADVCREIGGSRRQAEYRFRIATGRSIGETIIETRIARAKDLLLKRSLPIESIFSECGYESEASFRRAFKNTTGMSMREWRNSCAPS